MTKYEDLFDSCLFNMKNYLFESAISDLIKISKLEDLTYDNKDSLLYHIFQIQTNTDRKDLFLTYCNYLENDKAVVKAFKRFDLYIIEYLIDKKHNLNVKDEDNLTPLIEMIKRKEINIIERMIDNGASVSFVGNYGNSPLNYAVDMDSLSIMNLLISKGADIHQKNDGYDSVLMRTLRGNLINCIGFLLKHDIELTLNKEHENAVSVALDQAKHGLGYENAAIMVLTQAAIKYPHEITNFKKLSGFEIIKERIIPALSSIEFQIKMTAELQNKPEKFNNSSNSKL